MRRLNGMFDVDGDEIIKRSNGEPISHDEPIFLLRARDICALNLLIEYEHLSRAAGSPEERILSLKHVYEEFSRWRLEHCGELKIPGSTFGR